MQGLIDVMDHLKGDTLFLVLSTIHIFLGLSEEISSCGLDAIIARLQILWAHNYKVQACELDSHIFLGSRACRQHAGYHLFLRLVPFLSTQIARALSSHDHEHHEERRLAKYLRGRDGRLLTYAHFLSGDIRTNHYVGTRNHNDRHLTCDMACSSSPH